MKGEILFEVQTFMGVKLLEHAAREGIPVLNISAPDEHTLNVWVCQADEKAFRALIEKFSLPYTVVSIRGRARIRKTLKAHIALIMGLIAGIALVYMLSLRIWLIDIEGADDEMKKSLAGAGVSVGHRKSLVDVSAVSRLLEAEYPEYAHIGVKISGVVLKIDCVKAETAPDVYDITKARSLIAKTDGVIVDINVFAGQAQVKSGDTVFKGDILILGEERAGKDGEITPVRAEGSVTARVWTKGESAVRLTYKNKVRTGKTSAVTVLKTPFFTRKLAGENPFELYDAEVNESSLVGLFVPVRLIRYDYYECRYEDLSIGEEEAERISFENALVKARADAPAGAEEIRRWKEYKHQGENTIACTAVVEWIMDIATSRQGG